MWRERFKRLFILGIATGLTVFAVMAFVKWRDKKGASAQVLGLSKLPIEEELKDFGEKILGVAIKKIKPEKQSDQEQEGEPITQPTENIQNQTNQLMESIKRLPEDQIKAIKKQIYKDFCQQLIEE